MTNRPTLKPGDLVGFSGDGTAVLLVKARDRATSRLHALRQAAKFARERQRLCDESAERYKTDKADDPYWERSERCAANEARYIAEEIERLIRQYGCVR